MPRRTLALARGTAFQVVTLGVVLAITLICHSDRGSQYASHEFRALLTAYGIVARMSRRADCRDNARAESFFSTLKLELVYESAWQCWAEVRVAVFEYLEVFYNGQRLHSPLGHLSPVAFERQYDQQEPAAQPGLPSGKVSTKASTPVTSWHGNGVA